MALKTTSGDNISFHEDFRTPKTVADNGGVIGGGAVTGGKYVGDGTTAKYVQYPNAKQISGTIWSVRIKFKLFAYDTGFCALTAKDKAGQRAYVLGVDSLGKPYFELYPGGGGVPSGTTALALNTVHDVVYVSDGTNTKFYANGVQNGTTGTLQNIPRVTGNVTVGRRDYTGNERSANGEIYEVEYFQGVALTAEECKDLYERDTVPELDMPLLYLPLRSSYYKENGVELLIDGDMEAADTSAWSFPGTSIVTKDAGAAYSGSLGLKIERDATGYAFQNILTSGKRYKVTGWAKGDGVNGVPQITASAAIAWTGTSSTDWQQIEGELLADSASFTLRAGGIGGSAVYFDEISVELMENLTENKGTLGGACKLGDGSDTTLMPTMVSPKGFKTVAAGDYAYYPDFDKSLLGNAYTVMLVVDPASLTASTKFVISTDTYSSGFGINIYSDGAYLYHNQAGVITVCSAGYSQKKMVIAMTVSPTLVAGYIDGKLSNSQSGSYAALTGADNIMFFDSTFVGLIQEPLIYAGTMSPQQVSIKTKDILKSLNV